MADADRAPSAGGQETLIREIEQTRQELARTIDAITDRVSPANVARRTADGMRQRAQALDPMMLGAGALVAVGLVAFLVWRRRR
jgi:MYXO-CTERM domain-containing protein